MRERAAARPLVPRAPALGPPLARLCDHCRLVTGPQDGQIRVGCQEVPFGPPRTDRPDRAACRARPAQRAFARDFSSNCRELSRHRRAGRLAQHFAPDRGAAVAGVGAQRDVRSRAARPDLRAAYLGRTAADRTRPAVFRRCPDAGRRSHRTGTAVDPDPACLRRQGAIGRGGAWRSADAAVRPHPGRGRGADGEIQFAAEAYRIRAAGAGTGAGGAGRRGRPGRKPRADAAAGRSVVGADRGDRIFSTRGSGGGRWRKRVSSSKPR